MPATARRTHLYEYHRQFGSLTEFAGFEMPLWYEAIAPEHLAVRNSAGLFDVTHMGRSLVSGRKASEFLDYVLTRDPSRLNQLQGQYALLCNDRGGIRDDLTVFRLSMEEFLVIYNASNREKDFNSLEREAMGFEVQVQDVSDSIAMFAVQGPKAQMILQRALPIDLATVRRYWLTFTSYKGKKTSISRSGYTGEDGFEIHLWDTPLGRPQGAIELWNDILAAGKDEIRPCGLGARDTLRLEAGMCLYGNDIDEETTPFEAKLDFAVKLDKPRFIGRDALIEQKQNGVMRIRVGLKMLERAIPRRGFLVLSKGERVGELTSGTFSPLLQKGIAMAYLRTESASEGTTVDVDVRGRTAEAVVSAMPFYDPEKYGWRRKQTLSASA